MPIACWAEKWNRVRWTQLSLQSSLRLFRGDERTRLALDDLGRIARIAIDKRLRWLGSLLAGKPHHLAMTGRKRASWVGVARISSDRHGLTAAAAEVDLAKGARAAWLLHP